MIIELIIALKISLVCMAIFACGWKDMIFHKPYKMIANWIMTFCNVLLVKIRIKHRVSKDICKPLFFCPVCMSSFWTLLFWIILGFSNPILMILYVCGINVVLTAIIAPIIPDNEN